MDKQMVGGTAFYKHNSKFFFIFTALSRVTLLQSSLFEVNYCLLVLSADNFLQTVWKQIEPDKMSGLILIQTVLHSGVFWKNSEKKSADNKKACKISQHAKS